MGAFPPFSEGISQASQIPDLPRTPAPNDWGIVAPFIGHHLSLRAPKSASRGGDARKGEGGLSSLPLCPLLWVLQAHRTGRRFFAGTEGKVSAGACPGWQPLAAGPRCLLPWRAAPSPACPLLATAASPASRAPGPSGCRILATALPSHDRGQVCAEVEQGRWDLRRGLKAVMLSRGGREQWPTSLLLFTARSLLLLPVTFLTF